MPGRHFTPEEDQIIRDGHASGITDKAISARLGRTEKTIWQRAKRIGLPNRDPRAVALARAAASHPDSVFSPAEEEYIVRRWGEGAQSPAIAEELGRLFAHKTTGRKVRVYLGKIRWKYDIPKRSTRREWPDPRGGRRIREPIGEAVIEAGPEDVQRLRAFMQVAPAYGDCWLVDGKEVLTLAQIRGRLMWESRRRAA